jgi:hypothetical protein
MFVAIVKTGACNSEQICCKDSLEIEESHLLGWIEIETSTNVLGLGSNKMLTVIWNFYFLILQILECFTDAPCPQMSEKSPKTCFREIFKSSAQIVNFELF